MRTALVVCSLAALAPAQRTFLVNESPSGAPLAGGGFFPDVSHDGRYVVYEGSGGVWLRDMQGAQYERISVSSYGVAAATASQPRMSADARYVAFVSYDKHLVVPNDVLDGYDIFLRDRQLGTTSKLSVTPSGGEVDGPCVTPAISADGSRVAFTSEATDLVSGDWNDRADVFVRDLTLGTIVLVSASPFGPGNQDSGEPALSGDGRFVAFASLASDLVPADTNGMWDVFVRDLQGGTLVRTSVSASGAQADGYSNEPSLSADGRYVAFRSYASNLVTPDLGGKADVFVRDLVLGTIRRASQSASGVQGNDGSFSPTLSADGRYCAFICAADNLLPAPSLHRHGAVRVDLATGQVVEVASSVCGVPIGSIGRTRISADGNAVVYESSDEHAAPMDVNGVLGSGFDVFLHDVSATAPAARLCAYCIVAPTMHGCLPSIASSGTPSATAGSGFVVSVGSVDGQRAGLFVFGSNSSSMPWGLGGPSYRCVSPIQARSAVQSSGGTQDQCDGALLIDANASWPPWAQAGACMFLQGWFREPASVKGSHFSDALALVIGP